MDLSTRLLLLNRRPKTQYIPDPLSNNFQESYQPVSSRRDPGFMAPKHMKAPMREAIMRIQADLGDVDSFVARELQYNSVAHMHQFFMGLQVDAMALAIWQIQKGNALIESSQTGVGKGREAAGICRWAILNRILPVFCTYSDTLFTDFQRDLDDIDFGSSVWPLLFNANSSITEQTTGRKMFKNSGSMRLVLERIAATGELPRGRNALYLTYSQVNTENVQQDALRRLAPGAIMILDESHNAGGIESNTGIFFQDSLALACGVFFMSATWAKRADNLPLYSSKTDISIAIPEIERVADAIKVGGDPLLTVVSNQLAQAGQLLRRERSFEGISIFNFIDERNKDEHERISDQVTEVLRAIMTADLAYHSTDFERFRIQHRRKGQRIRHHKFSGLVHNIVKQFLLGLKCDAAADRAIESIQAGEKPIIAVESTMGAFLDSYTSANRTSEGDLLDCLSWSTILQRALDRTIYYTFTDKGGKATRVGYGRECLCELSAGYYRDADKLLEALSISVPVSPIDWIRHRISQAGYTVAEITGRFQRINYSGPAPVLSHVPEEERTDRVKTGRLFNNGGLDCLVVNQAGSTGISLHSSEKFADQKVRHMVVAQPAGDVAIFCQLLGRINRTGQVNLPRFTMLSVALPAEVRPSVNLTRKLKSLNANTSSNTRSALSVDAPDLMNKYGDKIVAEWLSENPQTAALMDLVSDKPGQEGSIVEEDLARVATGRAALLPVKDQREFIETISETYVDYIAYLDEIGENDLEPRTYDFDAEQKTAHVIFEGLRPDSPFGQDAVFGEYSIKRQGKSYTPEEVQALMAETFGEHAGKAPNERDTLLARKLGQHLEGLYLEYRASLENLHTIERAAKIRDAGRGILSEYRVGCGLRLELNGDVYNGIIYRIDGRKNISGNPYAPSSLKFYIAVNGPLREVRVPGSQIRKITLCNLGRNADPAALFCDHLSDSRQRCKLITGNLLAAYGRLKPGMRGRIVSFTTNEGGIKQGILLPIKFDWTTDLIDPEVPGPLDS